MSKFKLTANGHCQGKFLNGAAAGGHFMLVTNGLIDTGDAGARSVSS